MAGPTFTYSLLAFSFCFLNLVQGHIQMVYPYPFKSASDSANSYLNIDYSMTAPLAKDGSDYPCKGYNSLLSTTGIKDTLTAGSSYTVALAGTATHNGGSCQISLSYDGGDSFIVIHSIIGGCPLQNSYTFTVPKDAPAADKIMLAWSWHNHSGNREMYQNCSPIKLINSNKEATLTAPAIYRANTFADGSCITPEGIDLVYPNPGKYVVYGGAYSASSPPPATNLPNCAYDETKMLTVTSNGSVSSGGSKTSDPAIVPSNTPVQVSVGLDLPATSTSTVLSTPKPSSTTRIEELSLTSAESATASKTSATIVLPASPSPAADSDPSPIVPPTSCVNNAIRCTAKGYSFDSCWENAWTPMGAVAEGTVCRHGQIVMDAPEEKCSSSAIKCTSRTTWSLCSNNSYIPMGKVAPGTICSEGKIIAMSRNGHLKRRMARQLLHRTRI